MFLACVEIADDELPTSGEHSRVLQLKFDRLENAKIWAQQEAQRRRDATGNAVVFEAMGPFLSLAWEHDRHDTPNLMESSDFASHKLTGRA